MLPVKTIQPDYRFTDFEKWKRHIKKELFHTQNKNLINKAKDIISPRIKMVCN